MLNAAQRYSTAVLQINYPVHNGRPNPAHGMFFFAGSIPTGCWDASRNNGRGGSKLYPSEDAAIRDAIANGSTYVQGVGGRKIDIAAYA